MFTSLTRGMASGIFDSGVINNAILESFTIHTRILLDFLYSNNPRSDDVIAEDYFPEPAIWHNSRPHKSELIEMVHYRVGKEVAHLTYTRQKLDEESKKWPFLEIAHDIEKAIDCFLRNVSDNLLGERWSEFLKQKQALSRQYMGKKIFYTVKPRFDGVIELSVFHGNKAVRNLLVQNANKPGELLKRREAFSRSQIQAEYWLAKVLSDYNNHFENDLVEIIFS